MRLRFVALKTLAIPQAPKELGPKPWSLQKSPRGVLPRNQLLMTTDFYRGLDVLYEDLESTVPGKV